MIDNLPEIRRKKLKELLKEGRLIKALEASNGLGGLIVENTKSEGRQFDAMWLSSLCDSAFKGKPDNETVDFSSRIQTVEEIFEVTTKPMIFDADTGGLTEHFINNVRTLERLGVSAVVIEDKRGLKCNSLLGDKNVHVLEDADVFADKIAAGKKALQTDDFMIIARIESFIAGESVGKAMVRARKYIDSGADGIMIHSNKDDGEDIKEFLREFRNEFPEVLVVLVPTAYPQFNEEELARMGADIVIYANHLLRSAYKSMLETAQKILQDGCSLEAGDKYCVSVKEILEVIGE